MPEKSSEIKTRGARFVRFYPSDWRSGCMGLTLEQEGLYVRICAFIYESGHRLTLDDCRAAKFMGVHTNAYRKVRDQLHDLGKLVKCDDGWTVSRAEKELAAAVGASVAAHPERVTERQAHPDAGRDTGPDTLVDTPHNTPIDTPIVTGVVFSENANQINGPSLEPIANSQEPKKEAPKPPAGASGEVIEFAKPVTDWRTMFGTADDHAGVEVHNGELVLVNGTRQHWLTEFGNDERALANALKEAHAAVNAGSRKSLKVQVEARLASIVRDLNARRQNALAIAAQREKPKKPFKPSRWALG